MVDSPMCQYLGQVDEKHGDDDVDLRPKLQFTDFMSREKLILT